MAEIAPIRQKAKAEPSAPALRVIELGGYSDDGGERPRVIPAGILHQNSGCGSNARQKAAGGGVSISCEGYDGVGAGRKVPASARPAVLFNKCRGKKYDIC
jgi:hypothetical protein